MAPTSVDFVRKHAPTLATSWEVRAYEIVGAEKSSLPWPWVALMPGPAEPEGLLSVMADLAWVTIPRRASVRVEALTCLDLAWTGLHLPEDDGYVLMIDAFGADPLPSLPHPPKFPVTPAPGYRFSDPDADLWDCPVPDNTRVSVVLRNTSDNARTVRVRASALIVL